MEPGTIVHRWAHDAGGLDDGDGGGIPLDGVLHPDEVVFQLSLFATRRMGSRTHLGDTTEPSEDCHA